jgi:arylsulfatase A-like enzyme
MIPLEWVSPMRRVSKRWFAAAAALLVLTLVLKGSLGKGRHDERGSILLISIDTLRADHLGCYGYRRRTSPFIDSVAAAGTVFENAMVPLPATGPSHASLLTGLHPIRHGVLTNSMRLASEVETMAEVLGREGYHTMAATAVFHLGGAYGFDQGFQDFSDEGSRQSRAAWEVNSSVTAMLEAHARNKRAQPYFLFVHYFDAHSPYERRSRYFPPEPVPEGFPPLSAADRERVESYDSEVRYVDTRLQQLVEQVEAFGLGRNLTLCIASDHGEQFGEHGFSGGHADLYRETVRVPVVCRGPGLGRHRIDRVVSLLDLAPSLLTRAGARFSRAVDGVPTMFDTDGPPGTARDLLVLGYPSYTRSLQVIQDPWVYIRNLENVYRALRIDPSPAADPATLAREGFREARPGPTRGGEAVYPMPELDFDPYVITAVMRARPGCGASVEVKLEPHLSYLGEPIPFSRAMRIDYPVSRFDRTSIVVSPAHCAGGVFFKFARLHDHELPGATVATKVFANLLTARKGSAASEVFDSHADPGMLRNVIGTAEGRAKAAELERRLPGLYAEYLEDAFHRDEGRDYTPVELEMLRSLGYVR